MRHVITRDAFPYSAFVLENFRFSFKARYVNDVHLPRFAADCQSRSDRFCQSSNLYGTATRNQMHRGDSKDFSPSNAWNDSKNGGGASMARTRPNWHTVSDTRCQNANSAPRLQTRCGTMHVSSKRLLLPGHRSADDIAVRANWNLVRHLALRW